MRSDSSGEGTSLSDRNKAIVRRLVEEWQGGHRREVGDELLADDFVDSAHGTGPDTSKERALDWWDDTFRAFPDLSAEIRHIVAEGDLVATYKTFTGTHTGAFMGIPSTGRRATFDAFDLLRLREGKVVDHWVILDVAGLLRHLGVMPPMGAGERRGPEPASQSGHVRHATSHPSP
jgi:predicted ester cyclase